MSAKTMGIAPQVFSGKWMPKTPSGAAGLQTAVFNVFELPAEKVDETVRALVRQWTLELLEAFLAAAESGRWFATWDGPSPELAPWTPSIYARLRRLVDRGDRCCGFRADTAVAHRKKSDRT